MKNRKKELINNQKGFSLIELIVVIAILGIIAGGLALVLTKYIGRSKRAVDINSGDEIARAVERNIDLHPDVTIPTSFSFNSASTTMPTEATATSLMDFALTDFADVPESRNDESYFWTVEMDTVNKKVDKVYLAIASGGTDYEVYPDGSAYLKGP